MNQWFVIKTKSHRELDVHNLLTRAHFKSFLPRIRQVQHKLRATHLNVKPLFPGYLFIYIDFTNPSNIHLIKYTRGVSHILCAENKPVAVPDEVVNAIKSKMNDKGYVEQPMTVEKGEKVRVKKGMLADLEGIIEKKSSDDERVIVLLNMINYNLKATLHWSEIEKIRVA
ncbi:hypothetical protein K1X76_03605 [bacterium]|nr:hypothetical protein [bacterium]